MADTLRSEGSRFHFTPGSWLKSRPIALPAVGFLVLATAAVWFSLRLNQAGKQRQAVAKICELGGRVFYEYQYTTDSSGELVPLEEDQIPEPGQLEKMLGRDFFDHPFYVTFAHFHYTDGGLVSIGKQGVSDAELVHLKALPHIRWLALNGTRVSDAGLEYLREFTELERLWLSYTDVTDRGMEELGRMIRFRHLSLDGTRVGDAGLEHLGGLTGLESLSLNDTRVTDAGLSCLKELGNLERLSLATTRVTDTGLQSLRGLTRLQRLDLSGTHSTDAGMTHLAGLANLQHLLLDGTRVGDLGMEHIGGLTDLELLSLSATDVGDAGLTRLKELTKLDTLQVNESNCTLAGVVDLYAGGQGRSLDEALDAVALVKRDAQGEVISLDLSGIRVTDAGLVHVCELPKLEWLFLNGAQVTDAGLVHLADLTELVMLDLVGTQVTDAGLHHLLGAAKLRTLHLGQTRVTEGGIEELSRESDGRIRSHRVDFSQRSSQAAGRADVSSHVNLANVLASQGRTEEAKAHLLKAIQHRPDRKEAHHGLASIFQREQKLEDAIKHCREALRIDPEYFKAQMSLGLILLDTGEIDEGREHLAKALDLKPKDAYANYYHGHLLHLEGDIRQAAVHYQRSVENDGEFVPALLGLVAIRLMADHPELYDVDDAVALAEKACKLTEMQDPLTLDVLAGSYALAGRLNDAANVATRALELARAAGDDSFADRIQKSILLYRRSAANREK